MEILSGSALLFLPRKSANQESSPIGHRCFHGFMHVDAMGLDGDGEKEMVLIQNSSMLAVTKILG